MSVVEQTVEHGTDGGRVAQQLLEPRQLSTMERIAATFGPACALPICNQFFLL